MAFHKGKRLILLVFGKTFVCSHWCQISAGRVLLESLRFLLCFGPLGHRVASVALQQTFSFHPKLEKFWSCRSNPTRFRVIRSLSVLSLNQTHKIFLNSLHYFHPFILSLFHSCHFLTHNIAPFFWIPFHFALHIFLSFTPLLFFLSPLFPFHLVS